MRYLTTGVTRWGLIAAGLSLGGTALAWALWGGALFSPGPLSAQHDGAPLGGVESHAELESRCSACHAPLGSATPMSARCLDCHTDIQPELGDSTTLHGAFTGARACLSCHTEHAGRSGELTRIGDQGAHDRFGFSLAAHRRTAAGAAFNCSDCHSQDTWRFEPSRCVSCHRDYQADFVAAHLRRWGEDCSACHDGVDRFSTDRFDHDTTSFLLEGAHRKVSCEECHTAVRGLGAFADAPKDCHGCHEQDDTHKGEYGNDCSGCHSTDTWKNAKVNGSPAVHEKLGFSLTAHRKTSAGKAFTCRDCHTGGSFRQAATTCIDCHRKEDPRFMARHQQDFGDDCRGCHDGKDRYGKGVFSHDSTRMPLDGAHQRIGCGECHEGARKPADFRRGATDCLSCHRVDDRHRGRFGTDCAACHSTRTWEGARFDHDRTTASCISCHRADDRHRGRFGTDCAACHSTRSWEGARFEHRFPIDHGEGGNNSCETCHADAPNYKTYTCYGCHEHSRDRVLRQHREEGVPRDLDNCVRCHRGGGEHEGRGERGWEGEGDDDD